ncbi:MAG: signal recognition particle-docking protein FtsY [Oscillospiraceae bacterium]|nr:signal recognition particle-docking protein FtsY [Oscillospiraceae bacterium]
MGFFDRIIEGLARTKKNVSAQLGGIFASFTGANDEFFDELEETLILADVGADASARAVGRLREITRERGLRDGGEIRDALADILTELLDVGGAALRLGTKPSVILVTGVNGVGKTTTIGKLAANFTGEGKKVLLCAGDTFRAAAAEQLTIWAERAGADIVRREEGSDPASVVYDAIAAAKARGADIIICDTAGRLHNKSNLMNELGKISRVIDRGLPGCDRETLLVLDATTGQNGLTQAKQFKEYAGISGIALTKLDGTAKGGIVVAITDQLKIPVKLIGIGEKTEDLLEFDGRGFVEALLR